MISPARLLTELYCCMPSFVLSKQEEQQHTRTAGLPLDMWYSASKQNRWQADALWYIREVRHLAWGLVLRVVHDAVISSNWGPSFTARVNSLRPCGQLTSHGGRNPKRRSEVKRLFPAVPAGWNPRRLALRPPLRLGPRLPRRVFRVSTNQNTSTVSFISRSARGGSVHKFWLIEWHPDSWGSAEFDCATYTWKLCYASTNYAWSISIGITPHWKRPVN
jgi:hypothetical protein